MKKYLAYANSPDFLHLREHDSLVEAETWLDRNLRGIYGNNPVDYNADLCYGTIWDVTEIDYLPYDSFLSTSDNRSQRPDYSSGSLGKCPMNHYKRNTGVLVKDQAKLSCIDIASS